MGDVGVDVLGLVLFGWSYNHGEVRTEAHPGPRCGLVGWSQVRGTYRRWGELLQQPSPGLKEERSRVGVNRQVDVAVVVMARSDSDGVAVQGICHLTRVQDELGPGHMVEARLGWLL